MVLRRSIVYVFVDRSSEQGQATGKRQGRMETEAGRAARSSEFSGKEAMIHDQTWRRSALIRS
eukprot:scaffold54941_cov72-Cyclotella_meneghiniana.AAC.2